MTRIAAFLQPGWADWEIGPVASLARHYLGCELAVFTPDGADVVSVGGLRLKPDGQFVEAGAVQADVLLLIGAGAWVGYKDEELAALLRDHLAADRILGVICAGTAFAAANRLFARRTHTSNGADWLRTAAPDYAGAELYRDTPRAVIDGKLVTAPGSAPQTFAAALARLIAPGKEQVVKDYLALAAAEFSA